VLTWFSWNYSFILATALINACIKNYEFRIIQSFLFGVLLTLRGLRVLLKNGTVKRRYW
jgi:threonine/homoserine/homoserine lactone efflux protein